MFEVWRGIWRSEIVPPPGGSGFWADSRFFSKKNIYITLKFHDIIEYEFHIVQNFLLVTIDLYLDKICF